MSARAGKRRRDSESPEYDQLSGSLDGMDGGPSQAVLALRSRSCSEESRSGSAHDDQDDIVQISPPAESSNARGKRRRIATPTPEREPSYPPITSIQSQSSSSSLNGVREILRRRNQNLATPSSSRTYLPPTPSNLTPSASLASLPPATQPDRLNDTPSPTPTYILTRPNTPSPTGSFVEPVEYLAVENTYGGHAEPVDAEVVEVEAAESNRSETDGDRVHRLGADRPRFNIEKPFFELKSASPAPAPIASSSSSSGTKATTSTSTSDPTATSTKAPPTVVTSAASPSSSTAPTHSSSKPKQTPLSSYTCPICFSPPTNATLTPCGHLSCGSCLFTAVKSTLRRGATMGMSNDEPNLARCPVCRAVIEGWDGKGGGVVGIKVRAVFAI